MHALARKLLTKNCLLAVTNHRHLKQRSSSYVASGKKDTGLKRRPGYGHVSTKTPLPKGTYILQVTTIIANLMKPRGGKAGKANQSPARIGCSVNSPRQTNNEKILPTRSLVRPCLRLSRTGARLGVNGLDGVQGTPPAPRPPLAPLERRKIDIKKQTKST